MNLLLTVDQAKEIDRRTQEEFGIPALILMENAGRAVAEYILGQCRNTGAATEVIIVCGGGNNGGDGLVAARHLYQQNVDVRVFLLDQPERLKGDAPVQYRIVNQLGIKKAAMNDFGSLTSAVPRDRFVVLVDALLGTGFNGKLKPAAVQAIDAINAFKTARPETTQVVAVDIPSGLSGDAGALECMAVKADVTLTFVAPKQGLLKDSARPYVGRLEVIDIGVPKELLQRIAHLTNK